MAEQPADTRTEIIEAARQQFIRHGYEGARLQLIADEVGVTKAMIHYYFNTKQELFERVYAQSLTQIFGGLTEILEKDVPLFKKIEELISACLQIAESAPQVLTFVVTESSRKPDLLQPILEEHIDLEIQDFNEELEQAASNYQIASVRAETLLLQVFSLCYYPVLSKTINDSLFNIHSGEARHSDAAARKGVVLDTILNWLTA